MRLCGFVFFLISFTAFGKSVFLNGKDVSSATGKKLEGVNISIAENGDIYISAPQYQVLEEVSYTPLGQGKKDLSTPVPTEPITSKPSAGLLPEAPASELGKDSLLEEKPGTKLPQ